MPPGGDAKPFALPSWSPRFGPVNMVARPAGAPGARGRRGVGDEVGRRIRERRAIVPRHRTCQLAERPERPRSGGVAAITCSTSTTRWHLCGARCTGDTRPRRTSWHWIGPWRSRCRRQPTARMRDGCWSGCDPRDRRSPDDVLHRRGRCGPSSTRNAVCRAVSRGRSDATGRKDPGGPVIPAGEPRPGSSPAAGPVRGPAWRRMADAPRQRPRRTRRWRAAVVRSSSTSRRT